MKNISTDEYYMLRAIALAKKGLGSTSPNPSVGAVIVKDGQILGEGFHAKAGEKHAEIAAMDDAYARGNSTFCGATIYVTLEPCCHTGKTPPCSARIVTERFARLVVGSIDPNPKVCGGGIANCIDSGISTTVGVMKNLTDKLIEGFAKRIVHNEAFCTLKFAQSLDGKIAAADGTSCYISSSQSRAYAHILRSRHDAIIVGANTIFRDNPQLIVRQPITKPFHSQPWRIVIGGTRQFDARAKLFATPDAPTIIATAHEDPFYVGNPAEHVRIWHFDAPNFHISLRDVLKRLAHEGKCTALLEGGGKLAAHALKTGAVDKIIAFVAPILIGTSGIPAVDGIFGENIDQKLQLYSQHWQKCATDMILHAYTSPRS